MKKVLIALFTVICFLPLTFYVQATIEEQQCTLEITGLSDMEYEIDGEEPNYLEGVEVKSSCSNAEVLLEIIDNVVDLTQEEQYTLYYMAYDKMGNSLVKTRKISVFEDITPPVINGLPEDKFIFKLSTELTPELFLNGVTAEDNKDGIINDITVDYSQVNSDTPGIYQVTYSVTDTHGNTKEVTVPVEIVPPPHFSTFKDIEVEVGKDIADIDFEDIQAYDYENQPINYTFDLKGLDTSTLGTYEIEYKAVDRFNYETTVKRNVVVIDTTKPVIVANDFTIEYGEVIPDWVDYITVTDNYDEQVTIDINSALVNRHKIGDYPVMVTATDSSGNTQIKVFIVSIVDTEDPTLLVEKSLTFLRGSSEPNWYDFITYSDNYDEELNVTFNQNVNFKMTGIYYLTVKVTDTSGNDTEKTIAVLVMDTVNISYKNDSHVELPVFSNRDALKSFITILDKNIEVSIVDQEVNYQVIGDYHAYLLIKGLDGKTYIASFNLKIVDDLDPVIDGPEVIKLPVYSDIILEDYFTIFDNYDDHGLEITIDESQVNYDVLGTYTVTVTATDGSGNVSSKLITIKVVDEIIPEIKEKNELIIEINKYRQAIIDLFEISDNYEIETIFVDDSQVKFNEEGTYPVSIYVTDTSGNLTNYSFNVKVVIDITKPIITIPTITQVIEVNTSELEWMNLIEVSDNFDPHPVVTIVENTVDITLLGEYYVKYVVTDAAGNSAEAILNVSVVDTTAPIFYGTHARTIYTGNWYDIYSDIIVIDNYDGNISDLVQVNVDDFDTLTPGTHILTFYVCDSSGNEAYVDIPITVMARPGIPQLLKHTLFSIALIIVITGIIVLCLTKRNHVPKQHR